jgi:hypothetical protein
MASPEQIEYESSDKQIVKDSVSPSSSFCTYTGSNRARNAATALTSAARTRTLPPEVNPSLATGWIYVEVRFVYDGFRQAQVTTVNELVPEAVGKQVYDDVRVKQ